MLTSWAVSLVKLNCVYVLAYNTKIMFFHDMAQLMINESNILLFIRSA